MADAQTANDLLPATEMPSASSAGLAADSPRDNPVDRVFKGLQNLPQRNRMALLAAIPVIVALIATLVLWNRQPDYRVLFSGVNDVDGGNIVNALNQMNVPHRYDEKKHAITVPAEKVHDTRLKLASQGLPKGSVVGFELMENQKLGVTQFQEHVNYQRALEGELSRSIMSLAAVHSARVHLAIPKPSIFLRDQQKPTASVILALVDGRMLDRTQVRGIVHLVASSLPELSPKNVTIVDQDGELLTSSEAQNQNMDVKQMSFVRSFENDYTKRVTDILKAVFGDENVKATVTAEFDFSQTDQVSENFKPNLEPSNATVRSQQSLESAERDPAAPAGVPGTLSNQPPSAAAAPIANNPQAGLGAAAGSASQLAAQKKESIINYEVDKVVRTTKGQNSTLKRVSAGVVVNYKTVNDPQDGMKQVPLTAQELEQINALVKEAIGYSKERGDTVNVVNQQFNKTVEKEIPVWKQPETLELAKNLGLPLAVAAITAVLVFGLIRPMLRQPVIITEAGDDQDAQADILLPPERQRLETTVGGEEGDEQILDQLASGQTTLVGPNGEAMVIGPDGEPVPAPPREDPLRKKLDELIALTDQYPQLVAVVIKEWMNGE
jgi:flagellar M-ring protein FliF